ncbi:MAG: universal stress protein [Deltaproteobacteria bacterium]|nr:universal stress protein [Deltaproteobacteria bacterium]
MYQFKRILVGLNLSDQDKVLARYAGLATRMAQAEHVIFLNVASIPDIPDKIGEEFPELLKSTHNLSEKQLKETVKEHFFGQPDTTTECEIANGKPLEVILKFIRQHEIDLVIVGKKSEEKASGMLSEKLARKAPCSVLIISEGMQPQLTKILTTLDFSDHSENAVKIAIATAKTAALSEIYCAHVYDVPSGYSRTGKSYTEFAKIMKNNAKKEFDKFIAKFDLKGLTAHPVLLLGDRPSKEIAEYVTKEDFDLLILGARGRSAGAAMFLGSVTERLIRLTECPLLAYKQKGEGLGILDAIFS